MRFEEEEEVEEFFTTLIANEEAQSNREKKSFGFFCMKNSDDVSANLNVDRLY